jgi:hypothetical protein
MGIEPLLKLWNDWYWGLRFRRFGITDCATPHRSCNVQPVERFLIVGGLDGVPGETTQFSQAEPRESSSCNGRRRRLREHLEHHSDFFERVRFGFGASAVKTSKKGPSAGLFCAPKLCSSDFHGFPFKELQCMAVRRTAVLVNQRQLAF